MTATDTLTGIPSYTAGTWAIDPVHSEVGFTVRHMMVSKVRGRFNAYSGEIVTAPDPLDSSVTAEIVLDSITTGNEQRDAHIRSADFFDVEAHPTMTYRSTGVRRHGDGFVVDGQLTPESAERATAHLAACRPCRDLVELERLTKARLSALCGPEPGADLVSRLLAMGGPGGPVSPRPGHVPGTPRPQPVTMPAPHPGAVQVLLRAARGEAPHRTDRTDWTERQAPQRDVPRPGQRREPPVPTRPTGRPRTTGASPSRLAVAVLGASAFISPSRPAATAP